MYSFQHMTRLQQRQPTEIRLKCDALSPVSTHTHRKPTPISTHISHTDTDTDTCTHTHTHKHTHTQACSPPTSLAGYSHPLQMHPISSLPRASKPSRLYTTQPSSRTVDSGLLGTWPLRTVKLRRAAISVEFWPAAGIDWFRFRV
jgi:hypothetical protein